MAATAPPLLRGEMAPPFELRDALDHVVRRSGFRGLKQLVLLFLDPANPPRELLAGLAARATKLDHLDTEVLVILPLTEAELSAAAAALNVPFRVLADPDLAACSRYAPVRSGAPVNTVVLLDQYGTAEERWISPALPTAEEVVDAAELRAIQCPE